MKSLSRKNLPPENLWQSWVREMILPDNVGQVCCYCGRAGDDLVDYMEKTATTSTFTFDLRAVLKANDKTLIPVEPPWIGLREAELLLVIEPIVACFECIEVRRSRLDIRSIGDKFVEKL